MTIYNKSTHPVEVKKISVRLWTLRDEIEAAIGRRMKECEAAGVPLYIDDIKRFYNLNLQLPLTDQSNVLPLHPKAQDGMTSLMESLGDEAKLPVDATAIAAAPVDPAAPASAAAPIDPAVPPIDPTAPLDPALAAATDLAGTAPVDGVVPVVESKTFNQAEEIIAQQTTQGLDTKKPNPILDRPYQRQAPDLDKLSYGFTFLSDLNMDQYLCFTKDKFLQGQSVVVEFLIPQNFMMTAEVVYCHFYALRSRIISPTKPDYRLQCRYIFSIPGERENLRNFLKSIEPTVPKETKKVKKEVDDDSLGL